MVKALFLPFWIQSHVSNFWTQEPSSGNNFCKRKRGVWGHCCRPSAKAPRSVKFMWEYVLHSLWSLDSWALCCKSRKKSSAQAVLNNDTLAQKGGWRWSPAETANTLQRSREMQWDRRNGREKEDSQPKVGRASGGRLRFSVLMFVPHSGLTQASISWKQRDHFAFYFRVLWKSHMLWQSLTVLASRHAPLRR